VPDLKPPQSRRGERDTLLALQPYQRDSVVRTVADVDDADARHAGHAEIIRELIGGRTGR
jgi:hypothetical protein